MKGILNTALLVTLLFSQVHQASAMSNMVVKPFQAQVITKVGQLVTKGLRVVTPYVAPHAAQGKRLTLKGVQFARQAGKSACAKTGALVAKYPEHAVLGSAVAVTGVGVAGAAKYAADQKTAAQAAATALQKATLQAGKAGMLAGAVQATKKAGSWIASTRVAQSMARYPGVWVVGTVYAAIIAGCIYQDILRSRARKARLAAQE